MGRVFAALLFMLCATSAAEELREQSRLHYQRGRDAYEKRDWATALAEFKKAYAIVPIPDFIYNIGRCQEQLGDFKNAASNYRLFLATKLDAAERLQLEEHIQQLEQVRPIPAPVVVVARPPPLPPATPPKPLYRRWWLWTTVGVVVAVGVGVGVGVGVSQTSGPSLGFPAVTLR